MLAIMIAVLTVGALATMAYKGMGTRPLYLAAMVIALVCAGACNMLIPSQLDILRAATEAERRGVRFLWDYGPHFVIVWLAVAFGCLLAVILYRRPAP
jgi:p-aminobenzoyl-glutamate transporter AbgT